MKHALLVFVGGGFGSVARYFLGKWFNNIENAIPYGTMLSNVLGSLLIGIVLGYLGKTGNMSQSQSLLLATGFCGGFTTFSTFGLETFNLAKEGQWLASFGNVGLSLILGLAAVLAGHMLSRLL